MAKQHASPRSYYMRWLIYCPVGLVLIGLGLSLFGDSLLLKQATDQAGGSIWGWFLYGTASLATFNAGLSVFAQGVIFRIRYERSL